MPHFGEFDDSGGGAAPAGVQLNTVNLFTKKQSVQPVIASISGTYIPVATDSNNFQLTATGNITLANPTGMTTGDVLNFCIDMDATGGWSITLGVLFVFPGGVTPSWSTAAGERNFISAYYDGSKLRCGSGAGYA